MRCKEGFVESFGYCVLDRKKLKAAYEMIYDLQRFLSVRAGDFQCNHASTDRATAMDLKEYLQSLNVIGPTAFVQAIYLFFVGLEWH